MLTFIAKGHGEEGIRSALSFNNPNQLGYFAIYLVGTSLLLMVYKDTKNISNKLYYILDAVIIVIAHILALLAWSRGAILGIICLDIWLALKKSRKIFYLLIPGVIIATALLIWRPTLIQERLQHSASKPITPEVAQQELEARLFHQLSIMKGIEYLVGRGGRSITFREKARGILDVHNLFGEIFRSYGLIGLSFFSFWLGQTIWQSRIVPGALWIWAGLLIYNMSHYGLRFRSFWILTALIGALFCILLQENSSRPAGSANLRPGERTNLTTKPAKTA